MRDRRLRGLRTSAVFGTASQKTSIWTMQAVSGTSGEHADETHALMSPCVV